MTRAGAVQDGRRESAVADALLAFLPVASAERLAPVLTDDDVATLKHLFRKSIPENTLRAIASDLGYLEAWAMAATGRPLAWPATDETVLKFIAHHLFDKAEKKANPAHGMPDEVAAKLIGEDRMQALPPHAPSTVRRRLSHWKKLHKARGLPHVLNSEEIGLALQAAVKASDRKLTKKSKKPITLDVLNVMLATCDRHRLKGRRDYALLLVAFGSGGRRRSEIGELRIEDIAPPVPADGAHVEAYEIDLRRAKRVKAQDGEKIYVAGRAARALEDWIGALRAEFGNDVSGPIFRGVDRWGGISKRALTPAAVNAIVKALIERTGGKPKDYSAHGLRSGFLTEARNAGIPLEEAMAHTKHRSYQVASRYYSSVDAKAGRAIRLADSAQK